MKLQQIGKNRICFKDTYDKDYRQSFLFITDVHRDSKYHNHKLLKKHLDQAKDKGAYVFSNGDWFDVMGCFKDPRSKGQDIKPEFLQSDRSYLDLIISESYEFLKPYRNNLLGFAYGNHETAILKHRDTDPLRRLVYLLNQEKGHEILLSQYYGFLFLNFEQKSGGGVRTKNIYHHHGYGGNAKRSKGVLNVDLDSQQYPFADVVFTGHTHQKWMVPQLTHKLKQNLEITQHQQYHVKGGSYKDSFGKGFGWEIEKGMTATPQGGWWIDFTYDCNDIHIEVTEAK